MIETAVTAGQRGVLPEELDAVTLDAYGTLLELRDPVGALHELVPEHSRDDVARAFDAEAHHYAAHAWKTNDAASLAQLHDDCARVFNDALGSSLSPAEYNGAMRFGLIGGVADALEALRARGLVLAVVANWDFGLHERLGTLGISEFFASVVTAGEAGARKPDPRPFRVALERIGVAPERALHVGDDPASDGDGARAAGLAFAPAPLGDVVRAWL